MRAHQIHSRGVRLSVVAVVLACGSACNTPSEDAGAALATERNDAAVHAVHSERLQTLMRELSRLSVARMPQEIDTSAERRRRSRAVAAAAADMADAAERIPDVLVDVQMAPEHRARFTDLANQLQIQSADLESLARDERTLEMEAKLYDITTTCTSCHSAFRVLPVVTSGPTP